MACSSGEATVSAMVFGVAPGKVARTTMVGGTTSGYSAMGSLNIASSPITKIAMESTPAKIGRRMKKYEKFIVFRKKLWLRAGSAPRGLRVRRSHVGQFFLRGNRHSRTDAFQAI